MTLVSGGVIVQGVTVFGNIARHWKIRGPEDLTRVVFHGATRFFLARFLREISWKSKSTSFFLNGSFRECNCFGKGWSPTIPGDYFVNDLLTCRVFVTAKISFFWNEESNKTCNTQGGVEVYHPTCMCLGSQNQLLVDHLVYMKMCEVN